MRQYIEMKRSIDQLGTDCTAKGYHELGSSVEMPIEASPDSRSSAQLIPNSSSFSNKLITHVHSRLSTSLEQLRRKYGNPIVAADLADILLQQLISQISPITKNSQQNNSNLSKSADKIFHSFIVLPKSLATQLLMGQSLSISDILVWFDEYENRNKKVFEHITSHHKSITATDWQEVIQNNQALDVYKDAAHKMGDKVWVQGGNDWMGGYMRQYYKQGGAAKYFLRSLRAPCDIVLDKDVLQGRRIKVLDVGSCYNPLAASKGGGDEGGTDTKTDEEVDVTAIDLCPAHPSVLKCDFLTVGLHDPTTLGEGVVLMGEEGEGRVVQSLP
ncbi:hypothetical protein EON65_41975, partial [archaeon]